MSAPRLVDINAHDFHGHFASRQASPVDAVPTHLPALNALCRDDGGGQGFARGWLVTVGANPGFGKSAIALNLASAALHAQEAVGYNSLEMSAIQLAARFYAIHTGTPIAHLERGGFRTAAWTEAQERMRVLPSFLVPDYVATDWPSVVSFFQECRQHGCRYFVLDYLQLAQTGDEDRITRAITEIVTDLRAWAVNERITVVCLSQFNRTTSANYTDRPRSQGLWGGMILEASSDLVLLLDHSRYERDGHLAKTHLIVDKNRHGPVGEIPIEWDYRTLQMRQAEPDEMDEWPEQRRRAG